MHFSVYIFLIQLSVVLADKIDTSILGFVLPEAAAETALKVYGVISKPFVQIRQTGWMLSYMVMPAVASLAAARDLRGLDRLKYDGPRLHTGVLLPVALLAFLYAGPFLSLCFGHGLQPDAGAYASRCSSSCGTLSISPHVQMAINGQIARSLSRPPGESIINLLSCVRGEARNVSGSSGEPY